MSSAHEALRCFTLNATSWHVCLPSAACPTCNQFKSLETTVSRLSSVVQELSDKLVSAEERLNAMEQCECLQSCNVDGVMYRDGEKWDKDSCTKCTCRVCLVCMKTWMCSTRNAWSYFNPINMCFQSGEVECAKPSCPVPSCPNPVLLDGNCCPICLSESQYILTCSWSYAQSLKPRVHHFQDSW